MIVKMSLINSYGQEVYTITDLYYVRRYKQLLRIIENE